MLPTLPSQRIADAAYAANPPSLTASAVGLAGYDPTRMGTAGMLMFPHCVMGCWPLILLVPPECNCALHLWLLRQLDPRELLAER